MFDNIFFTADLHLGEPNPYTYLGRPYSTAQEMAEKLIHNINRMVSSSDTLYIVGDVCIDREYLQYLKKINAETILVRGNHDRKFSDEVLRPYFKNIIPEEKGHYIFFRGYELFITHDPENAREEADLNIVGHVHREWRARAKREGYSKNMLNVGVDWNDFHPICLSSIQYEITKITGSLVSVKRLSVMSKIKPILGIVV